MRCHIICQVAIAAHLSQNGDVYVDTSASGASEVNTSFNSLGSISFKSVFLEAELALKECDSLSRPHVEGRHFSAHMFAHVRCCSTRTASHSKLKSSARGSLSRPQKIKIQLLLEYFAQVNQSLLARLKATASLLRFCLLGSRQLQVSFLARIRAPLILTVVLSANS